MNQEVWSFLVSRNKYLDYRAIVAPDFMCEQNFTSILAKAATREPTQQGAAYYRRIINSKVGELTLIYRVVEAVAVDTGIAGDGTLKDSLGREIDLIEGIVFQREVSQTDIVVTAEHFDTIHRQVIEHYRQFWDEINSVAAYASKSFSLSAVENLYHPLQLIKVADYSAGNKPRKDGKVVTIKSASDRSISRSWQPEVLEQFNQEINSIAISPDGNNIAIRYEQRKIILRGIVKNKLLDKRYLSAGNATPIVIDSTGKFLATAVIDGDIIDWQIPDENFIKLWDLTTKKSKKLGSNGIGGWNTRVRAVAFTPDSETIVSGGDDESIKLWDVSGAGEISIKPIPKHDAQIRCMAVDPNNSILASGDRKGNIKIWQIKVANLTEKMTVKANRLPVNSLAFSPNGKILASGSDYGTIKLWNMKTGEPYDRFQREHSTYVNSVAFSPNGRLIASGDDDGIIRLWNLKNEEYISLEKHKKAVTSVVFTPDGKLISGGKDGKLIKWEPVQ